MTKRLLAMVLVCILAIPILAIPASATTTDHVTRTQFDMFVTGLGNLLNSIEDNILYYLQELCYAVYDVVDAIATDLYNLIVDTNIFLSEIDSTLDYYMQRLWATISTLASDIGTYIQAQTTTIVNKITHAVATICQPLNQLVTYVQNLLRGNVGLDPDIDQIGEDIADSDDKYHDSMDIVQEATRPTYDDVYIEYDGLIGSGLAATIYGDCLSSMFTPGGFLYQILFVAFTLSMVSFVVFGKR